MNPTCATCRWRKLDDSFWPEESTCRRHAPTLANVETEAWVTSWPIVRMDDWCGDHQAAR